MNKNLLLILALFVGNSFAQNNIVRLVCDTPYVFTPDYEQREMAIIDLDKGKGSWSSFQTLMADKFDFIDGIFFEISQDTISSAGARIDRFSLELTYPYRKNEPVKKCKLVDKKELLKEQKKAKDWVKSARKI